MINDTLERELAGRDAGTWIAPKGGYFMAFEAMEGCAKAIVAKAKEAGVTMTPAGAPYPYGKDPKDVPTSFRAELYKKITVSQLFTPSLNLPAKSMSPASFLKYALLSTVL